MASLSLEQPFGHLDNLSLFDQQAFDKFMSSMVSKFSLVWGQLGKFGPTFLDNFNHFKSSFLSIKVICPPNGSRPAGPLVGPEGPH